MFGPIADFDPMPPGHHDVAGEAIARKVSGERIAHVAIGDLLDELVDVHALEPEQLRAREDPVPPEDVALRVRADRADRAH